MKEMKEQIICADSGICGGCVYQSIPYAEELELKERMVRELLPNAGLYLGIESGDPEGYRNKMEFSFGDSEKGGALALGIRKRRSYYEVVPPVSCNIVDADFRRIAAATQEFFRAAGERFYHKRTHMGALRYLVVRKASFTGEILVNLVSTSALATDLTAFADRLYGLNLDGKLAGVLHTVSDSVADAVKCDELLIIRGNDFFTERLLGLSFKISAFSFFQTNSAGAESLYRTVREFAGDLRGANVLDLYCGTGTIAQILASGARCVTGVELVPEAAEAAKANAEMNALSNCRFYAGDVLKIADSLSAEPDILVLDPPREGVHPKAMPKIINLNAKRIIYVSCKPSSLARDLPAFIANGYEPEKMKIHDLFPRTGHVETVVLMTRAGEEKA